MPLPQIKYLTYFLSNNGRFNYPVVVPSRGIADEFTDPRLIIYIRAFPRWRRPVNKRQRLLNCRVNDIQRDLLVIFRFNSIMQTLNLYLGVTALLFY